MFDRALNTPLELRYLFAFIFVWDSLNITAIPLQGNVSLEHLNNLKHLSYHKS